MSQFQDESAPGAARLIELVGAMAGQPVVMVVDLVVDRFVTGVPKRISREAPVLILRFEDEKVLPGGGGNAVANVAALGGAPLPFGAVGDDVAGRELLAVLAGRGIATGGIATRADYRTPSKTRILAGGRHAIKQQIVRYDIEDRLPPSPASEEGLAAALRAEAATAKAVVLSDYGYDCAGPGFLPLLRETFPGRPILGDSRYRLAELHGLTGATPNLEEAENLLGGSLDGGREELEAGGRALRDKLGWGFLLITRGSAGMSLFTEREIWHLPVHGTDQVADVTGAGDTVIGTLALALAAGASPLEAACLANYAGGIVVMKMGTATLTPDELRSAVGKDHELLAAIVRGGA
jgi:D-glycero-beta-D-manno-heptose-7-phosphate kinase